MRPGGHRRRFTHGASGRCRSGGSHGRQRTLVRSLIEAWNERDFDYFTHHITPETEIVDVGSGTTFRGPEGVRQYNMMWAEAFPDGRITIDHVYETGDTVVVGASRPVWVPRPVYSTTTVSPVS